jgi:CBS domain-containing protein
MTKTVADVMSSDNPVVPEGTEIREAIVKMTEHGFGCITVVDEAGGIRGVFTDGDLRRLLQKDGRDVLDRRLSDLAYGTPVTIEAGARLNDASELFHRHKVDTLLVVEGGRAVGMLDIQDL